MRRALLFEPLIIGGPVLGRAQAHFERRPSNIVAAIISRGNRLVPELVTAACTTAGVQPRAIDLLITNQPNPIFLRNWREALELPPAAHHDTFDRLGNLFGAGIPINLADALAQGKLARGGLLALGGFSHAGDYAAAALVRWPGVAA